MTAVTSMSATESIGHRGRSLLWAAPHHWKREGASVVDESGSGEDDGGVIGERA